MKKIEFNLKQFLPMFLTTIKHPGTLANYKSTFKMFNHIEETNIKDLIDFSKEVIDKLNVEFETKNLRIANIKSFCNWIALLHNQTEVLYLIKSWKRYSETKKRKSYNDTEMQCLTNELKAFNNPKFTLIFKLLAHNGLRLKEFSDINWKSLKSQDFKVSYNATKNGNTGWFEVPEYLKKDFIKYGVTHSYKTIQALFRSFRIFVKSRNPNFSKGIHAHMLRHYFITNGFLNTGSAELMRMLTGHKSTKMLEETYIHGNESYQKIIWDQVNMPVLNSLEVQDLRKQLEIRNKMIIYLKQKLIDNKIPYENAQFIEKRF